MRRIATLALCLLVLLPSSHAFEGAGSGGSNDSLLKVGVLADMRTTNILNSDDIWTSYVLEYCYDTVLKINPDNEELIPYILVGTERNGVPGLQPEETGVLDFMPGSTDKVVAYYDFTNVRFHDGEQVDIMDVIFSYHALALHPKWYPSVSPLMDNGSPSGNYSSDRWLWLWELDDGDGNPLTGAAEFHLTTPYYRFWYETMNIILLPRHVWEGTGKIRNSDGTYKLNIHNDFGRAIDPDNKGLGVNGARNPGWKMFDLFTGAMAWEPKWDEIIGNGMFRFEEHILSSHAKVLRYEGYLEKEIAGVSIHKPYIDGIIFIRYSTSQQATMALIKGEIDVIPWSIPPDFIGDLQKDPNIAIIAVPDAGFFYLSYNMRSAILGYPNHEPLLGDMGKPLRKAIAHLIDKKKIVDIFLKGYGYIGDSLVTPVNTFWYNSSLPERPFGIDIARSILDANGLIDNDGDGWRDVDLSTPGDQDDGLEILSPSTDYCPARAQSCMRIAEDAREANLNISCNLQSFGTLIQNIDDRTFDMYILGWAMSNVDPTDFLHSYLHSQSPGNIPGYKSSLFDQIITEATHETNISKRQELVKWAQGIVHEDLPIDVLYYRKKIMAYRVDRIVGWWIHDLNGIFNYWSLMNIHVSGFIPGIGFMDILNPSIKVASAVSSNSTEIVSVSVHVNKSRYGLSKPFSGATVVLDTTDGYLTPSNGTTNADGTLIATFHAPYVPPYYEHGLKVFISARVEMDWYESYTVTTLIVVFPEGLKFLSATIDLPFGDLLNEGDTALIDILIKDEYKFPVDNASIFISSNPSDAVREPQNSTTISGRIENVDFIAPEVDEDTLYRITVNASKPEYIGANVSASIYVLDDKEPLCSDCKGWDSIFWLLVLAAIFIAVAAIMVSLRRPNERT